MPRTSKHKKIRKNDEEYLFTLLFRLSLSHSLFHFCLFSSQKKREVYVCIHIKNIRLNNADGKSFLVKK